MHHRKISPKVWWDFDSKKKSLIKLNFPDTIKFEFSNFWFFFQKLLSLMSDNIYDLQNDSSNYVTVYWKNRFVNNIKFHKKQIPIIVLCWVNKYCIADNAVAGLRGISVYGKGYSVSGKL